MRNKKAVFIILFILFGFSIYLCAQISSISGSTQVNKCETNQYTITIENTSGQPITNIVVTNSMPDPGFSYVTGSSTLNAPSCSSSADPTISGTDLIWDIDAFCGGPYTLADGDTMTISFSMETDCVAVSGSDNVHVDYDLGGVPSSDDTALSIQVLPGAILITKNPNVIPAAVGDTVTWTLRVENTGLGKVVNVEVTDVLGAGLSYVSSTPAGDAAGQTITWDSTNIPGLGDMDPGEYEEITLEVEVIACENLDNTADAEWGCSPTDICYDTSVDGGSATGAIQLEVKNANLSMNPPNFAFNYCDATYTISFPITNNGDGTASNIRLYVDWTPYTIDSVTAPATYDSINGCFNIPDMGPNGSPTDTYTLEFTLSYSDWCTSPLSATTHVWQPVYEDDCGNEFYPPAGLESSSTPPQPPSLSVSKTGGPAEIQLGSSITYTIDVNYSGLTSCGSGTTSNVTVVDTIPNGFTVSLPVPDGGVWVDSGDGTGGTVTWTYDPIVDPNFSTSLEINLPGWGECETYCYTYATFTNTVDASVTDCCGCTLTASSSQTTAIECDEALVVTSEKTANPSTQEKCETITFTNTYNFANTASLDNVDLSELTFTEHNEGSLDYDAGSATVTLNGTPVSFSVTDNTPSGYLVFTFTDTSAVRNSTLVIEYDLEIIDSSIASCTSPTFYSWSTLNLGPDTPAGQCLGGAGIHEVTQVTIVPPEMSISIYGMPTLMNKCQTQTISLTITQTSSTANPKDVKVVLSGLNYYIVNPAATVCVGIQPFWCTPGIDGYGNYVWAFFDNFTGSGQDAIIQFVVRKRCTGSGDLTATVYYDDLCHDDNVLHFSDETCSSSDTYSPLILLSGDLLIEKTPEVYYATENYAEWKIYVTNRGNGYAYYIWVDDVLGSGLAYNSASVSPAGGVTINSNLDHNGGAINGVGILINEMAPGERREITLTADIVDCSGLTNDVSASWGCDSVDCQTPVTDHSDVLILSPNLVNTNITGTPINACDTEAATITLKNAGQVTLYNLVVTETLPAGLTYVAGTTEYQVNGGGWIAGSDPNPTTSPLQWSQTELGILASIDPGDTFEISFDLVADCTFTGGQITVDTQYENPCGNVNSSATSLFSVAFNEPDLSITKIRTSPTDPDPLDCNEDVTWQITVTNNSTYEVPVVWVEDTLGGAFTYDSSTGGADGGYNSGQYVYWEILNLPALTSATLTLTATTDSTPCSNDLDDTVIAYWGCGAADGDSSTNPSGEAGVCLNAVGISDTHSSTREPDMAFFSISIAPASINACDDDAQFTVTITNNGRTDASNVDLVIDLPAGLTYNPGSTTVTCPVGGSTADPTISGNQLIFYDVGSTASNLCDSIPSGGTATLVFSVHADCFVTSTLNLDLYYYDCCGNTQYSTSATHTLTSTYPVLSISVTPATVDLDCSDAGDTVTWDITVTNSGIGDADWVRVEFALGTNIAYDSSNPSATDMGGNVYGWEFGPLASGSTTTLQLTAHLTQPGNCNVNRRTSTANVYWGCKVGAVDSDPTTADYDCEYSTSVFDSAVVTIPDLRLNPNNHISAFFTCTADGTNTASIRLRVRNAGDAPINDDFNISVSDGPWTVANTFTGFGGTLPIDPGTQRTIFIDWPLDCMTCISAITVNLDSDDDICECRENNNSGTRSNIVTETYNLTVNSITAVCEDDGLSTVSVEIENDGCLDISGNFDVYLEDDQGNSATVTVSGGLAIGTTTVDFPNWPNDCTIPATFTATVDYNDDVCECDGTDNTLSGIVYNSASPDLIVTSITPSTTCVTDGTITGQLQITIQNQGNGPVSSDFRILVNDGQGWTSELWYNADLGGTLPLAAGLADIVAFNWARSFTATPYVCDFNITATVDSQNDICECTATNNDTTTTYTLPHPNLRVLSITPSCTTDGQYSIDVVVDNNGCGDANGVVVQLSDDDGQTNNQTINLSAGSQQTLTFSGWPVDGNPATLTFTATIDPADAICELSGTDNSTTQTYTRPNLRVVSITPECLADENYQVSVIIENNGSEAVTSDFRIELSDNDGHTSEQWFSADLGGSIPFNTGTSQTVIFSSWTVDCDPTTISFTATVDSQDDICESNGLDNIYTDLYTIFDLEATSVAASSVCASDGSITGTIEVTVANTGGNAINSDFQILVNDGQGWTSELWYNADLLGALPLVVGASETVTFNWTRDFTTEPYICDYTITAVVDSQSDICECTFTNNTNNTTYHVPYPDLYIESMIAYCDADGRLIVELVVWNVGCEDLSNNFNISISDNAGHTRIESFTASGGRLPLRVGTSQTLTALDWEFSCANPTIDFNVLLDPRNQVCELNGDNNTLDYTYILDEPDLQIPDVSWVCNADATITLTVKVSNRGHGDAIGAVLNVYDLASARIYSESFNLNTGGSKTIIFATDAYSGDRDHEFRFVVDQGESLCECDMGNNERSEVINCCSSGLVTAKEVDKTSVNACEEVEFNLTISNVGGLNAYNLIITDELADGLTYVPGSTSATWSGGSYGGDPSISGNTLQWIIEGPLYGGDPAGDELILTYKAQAGPCSSGRRTFTNTFTVTAKDGSGIPIPLEGCDSDDTDPLDSSSTEVTLICPSLSFERECSAVQQITLKDTFKYTIIISNNGDGGSELTDIEVRDELPEGWTLESFSSEGAQPASSPSAGSSGNLIWSYGDYKLLAGDSIRLTITIKPNELACGTTFQDTLTVSATDNCGSSEYSGEAQQCPVLVVCGVPLLELEKDCPRADEPGGIYRFELTLRNRGDGDAENAIIEDTLPDNFQHVPDSTVFDGQAFANPQVNGQALSWNLGTLEKETEHFLTFSAIAPADTDPGRYANQAQVRGNAPDGNEVTSNVAECYTILRREAVDCCLQAEEYLLGASQMPEGPLAFIEPYFKNRRGYVRLLRCASSVAECTA